MSWTGGEGMLRAHTENPVQGQVLAPCARPRGAYRESQQGKVLAPCASPFHSQGQPRSEPQGRHEVRTLTPHRERHTRPFGCELPTY